MPFSCSKTWSRRLSDSSVILTKEAEKSVLLNKYLLKTSDLADKSKRAPMKKNTLLYLDSDLVEKAKEANINISRFVEDKLTHELRAVRPKTAHEYLQKVIADTAERGASFYGEAHRLPFQIESLKLENIGLARALSLSRKNVASCQKRNAKKWRYLPYSRLT
jgi:post-segregation antitoxin (ccd killing protein)